MYRALDMADVRHRRGKEATVQVLMRRLLSLDYIIERPTLGWLPTEEEKVHRFEELGIDRGTLPYRKYGATDKAQPRYFALKLPIAVDEKAATFVYVEGGQSTDSELRAWGGAHTPLWGGASRPDFRRARRRRRHGRGGGVQGGGGAQKLDPGRRRAGRGRAGLADQGRPGHPSRTRPD